MSAEDRPAGPAGGGLTMGDLLVRGSSEGSYGGRPWFELTFRCSARDCHATEGWHARRAMNLEETVGPRAAAEFEAEHRDLRADDD